MNPIEVLLMILAKRSVVSLLSCLFLAGCSSPGYDESAQVMVRGDDQAALEMARQWAQADPADDVTGLYRALSAKVSTQHLRAAVAALESGDVISATTESDLALEVHGGHQTAAAVGAVAYGLLGEQHFSEKNFAGAESAFDRVAQLDSGSQVAAAGRAAARHNRSCQSYEDARELLEQGTKQSFLDAIREYEQIERRTPGFFDVQERRDLASQRLSQLYLAEARHYFLEEEPSWALATLLQSAARAAHSALPLNTQEDFLADAFEHSQRMYVNIDIFGGQLLGSGLGTFFHGKLQDQGLPTGGSADFERQFASDLLDLNRRARALGASHERVQRAPHLSLAIDLEKVAFVKGETEPVDVDSMYIDGTKDVENKEYITRESELLQLLMELQEDKQSTKAQQQLYLQAKTPEAKAKAKKVLEYAQYVTGKKAKEVQQAKKVLAGTSQTVEVANVVSYIYQEQTVGLSYQLPWKLTGSDSYGRLDGQSLASEVVGSDEGLRRWRVRSTDTSEIKNVSPQLRGEAELLPEIAASLQQQTWEAASTMMDVWRRGQAAGDDLESQCRRLLMADRGGFVGDASLLAQARQAFEQVKVDHIAPASVYPAFEPLVFEDTPWILQLPDEARSSFGNR